MEITSFNKVKSSTPQHKPGVSAQTGFPSPATHYAEPTIDLNTELSIHRDTTFYVRVNGGAWAAHHIYDRDVLIIDRSLQAKPGMLALVVVEGMFEVIHLPSSGVKTEFVIWGTITYIIHSTR